MATQVKITDRIKCKKCHWEGHLSQCHSERVVFQTCPYCAMRLARQIEEPPLEKSFQLFDQDAVIISSC